MGKEIRVIELCGLFGKSKQAYYKSIKSIEKKQLDEQQVLKLVKEKRKLWKKGSGRNLHSSLKEEFIKHGIKMGRDKFFEFLGTYGLLMRRKRRKAITTLSYHQFHKYPNLIRDMEITKVNQVIVSDITYIWIEDVENFAYLFLVTEVYSRKIIGYCLSEDMKTKSGIVALKMALGNMKEIEGCIHHSDRGIQYCSYWYTGLLKKNKMLISMTENGDPLENAIAERINKTIKEDFTLKKQISFANFNEAKKEITKIIDFYNNQRPHRSIELLTPSEAYNMTRPLKRMWKTYYQKSEKKKEAVEKIIEEEKILENL